jgi:hypothetical protein
MLAQVGDELFRAVEQDVGGGGFEFVLLRVIAVFF